MAAGTWLATEALPWLGLPPQSRLLVPIGLLLGVLLSLAVAAVLGRIFLQPLDEIGRFAAAVAAGDLDRRLRWRRRPGQDIAAALDAMAEAVAGRIAQANSEKEQLQAVLGGMVEGVLVVNAAGRIVLANPRLRQMFSVWGEVAGRAPLEVIRHAGVDDALRAAAGTQDLVSVEIQLGGGEDRTILVNAVAFPAAGPRLGTVAVFHDVSELRRLETMRRDFVANVSHELKTPLTAVRGFAETLLSGDVPPSDVGKYLGVILKHAERLGSLIEDLLELSRIESRKVPLQRTVVDVVRIAAAVTGRHGAAAAVEVAHGEDRRAERITQRGARRSPRRRADPDQPARQRREVHEPGRNHRIARQPARAIPCRVDVQDDGIGIPEEDLPRIFERFYRVEKARSRDLGGTGLGLAIVKHLVQAMEGEIFVQSRLGRGSIFSFTLPRPSSRSAP